MSGPLPETIQDRTQTKHTHPIPGQKLKFLTPTGIEPGPLGWKVGTPLDTPGRRTGQEFCGVKKEEFCDIVSATLNVT